MCGAIKPANAVAATPRDIALSELDVTYRFCVHYRSTETDRWINRGRDAASQTLN